MQSLKSPESDLESQSQKPIVKKRLDALRYSLKQAVTTFSSLPISQQITLHSGPAKQRYAHTNIHMCIHREAATKRKVQGACVCVCVCVSKIIILFPQCFPGGHQSVAYVCLLCKSVSPFKQPHSSPLWTISSTQGHYPLPSNNLTHHPLDY